MNRRAFTLIELLLAMALAAVLMAAVASVLGAIARDRVALASSARNGRDAAFARAADLVRRDLVNGRRLWVLEDEGRFVITGYGGIDPRTLRPSTGLTRVSYVVRGEAMYREQEPLDASSRRGAWRELVCLGVRRVALTPVPDAAEPKDDAEPADEGAGLVIPRHVVLTIEPDGSSRGGLSEQLRVR